MRVHPLLVALCLGTPLLAQRIPQVDPDCLAPIPPPVWPGIESGLQLWLEASQAQTSLGLSNLVDGWFDQKPFGVPNNFAQDEGLYKPHYSEVGLYGHSTIHFDGNDYVHSDTGMATGSNYTKVAVIRPDALGSEGHVISGALAVLGQRGHGFYLNPSGHLVLEHEFEPQVTGVIPVRTNRYSVVMATYDGSLGVDLGRVYLNGRLIGSGTIFNDITDPSVNVGAYVHDVNGPQSHFHGDIPEAFVYSRVLNASERTQLTSYLLRKYAWNCFPTVSFDELPRDGQLIPRELSGPNVDTGEIVVSGTVSTRNYDSIELQVFETDFNDPTPETDLVALNGLSGPFALSARIPADCLNYQVRVNLLRDGQRTLMAERVNLCSGDVFLMNGQSNAVASDIYDEGVENNGPFSDWIRSFGDNAPNSELSEDLHWDLASVTDGPGITYGHTGIGSWGLKIGQELLAESGVPVAILNGAWGGTSILYHQRLESNPTEQTAIFGKTYGRLLYRAQEAGVDHAVRAMIWYQGVSDGFDPITLLPRTYSEQLSSYAFDFGNAGPEPDVNLYWDWMDDYPSIEKVYVVQTRNGLGQPGGCFWNTDGVREAIRQLPDTLPDVVLMSTTNLDSHDGCHYAYLDGYETLGINVSRQIKRDLYGSSDTLNIDPPNILSAEWESLTPKEKIVLTYRTPVTLNWDFGVNPNPGSEVLFELDSGETLEFDSLVGNVLTLRVTSGASTATWISYNGFSGPDPVSVIPWIVNDRGIGALTFSRVSIQDP